MKHKLMSALALLVGLLCAGNASAESRVPYDLDFESDILTGSHDFSLATGWGHVVDTFFDEGTWETLYVDYSVMPHSGVGGSTALAVGNQELQVSTDFATYTHDLYDLLVTPPLTGTATLQVKQILASGDVWFYRIVKDLDGSLTHGVEIETEKNLTTDGYTTVTLKGLRHQRVGIRVSNCLIDNFHADEADIALTPKLKIARLDQSANGTYADADEAGNYAVRYKVTLTNNGDIDLAPGDFTTDTNLPLTVPAHGARNVVVTMRADKPGHKVGTLQLQGNNVDYAVTLEGTVIDSTLWFVDFEDNRVPANMVAEKNWDTYDFPPHVGLRGNVYCAENYAINPPTKLISPLLEVHEGDSLTFDAAKRSDNSVMRIYYSADRNNWILLDSISDTAPDSTRLWNNVAVANKTGFGTDYLFGHYTLKNVPAGRWYIAFEAGYVYLDNLYGFKTVAVAHDVYVPLCRSEQQCDPGQGHAPQRRRQCRVPGLLRRHTLSRRPGRGYGAHARHTCGRRCRLCLQLRTPRSRHPHPLCRVPGRRQRLDSHHGDRLDRGVPGDRRPQRAGGPRGQPPLLLGAP